MEKGDNFVGNAYELDCLVAFRLLDGGPPARILLACRLDESNRP